MGEDFTWYVDEFRYEDSEDSFVLRYGINPSNIALKTLKNNSSQESPKKGDDKSSALFSKLSKANDIKKSAEVVIHEKIEQNVLQKAIDCLLHPEFSSKTILVSILARYNANTLKLKDKDLLETHTVVLYKQPNSDDSKKYDILVIDPTNFVYSSHIANINGNEKLKSELVQKDYLGKIISLNKKVCIYNSHSKDNVGAKSSQERDCIDIAVKLSFLLNKTETQINLAEIDSLQAIQMISNNEEIDKYLFFDTEQVVARIKQDSDIRVAFAFNKILQLASKYASVLSTLRGKLIDEIFSEIELTGKQLSELAIFGDSN